MANHFADGPFAVGVCVSFLFRRDAAKQNIQLVEFATQHVHDVVLADLIDVALKIGRVFSFIWTIHFQTSLDDLAAESEARPSGRASLTKVALAHARASDTLNSESASYCEFLDLAML